MDALEEGRILGESGENSEGETKASGSSTDEDSDSEPESPPVIRRKVSFADAFGLNLVSVKEFEAAEPEVPLPPKIEVTLPTEDFYMSCLFTVPSSPEDLDRRLQEQMVELESITLLPGTSTLRGFIRVVNLCYNKFVYARMSLDRWSSYFDLLAEYVPGSSDRKTDRFTFRYTLVPPLERGGTRVEVCLRYETAVGTFWANNKDMNYVLFCHQKGHGKEPGPPLQEENTRSKRSCLKANRRGSVEEKTRDPSHPSAAAEVEVAFKAQEADRKDGTDLESLLYHEEHKPVVESIKSRHRAARMARVQDYLSRRRQQVPTAAYPHDSAEGQKVSQPAALPAMWSDSAGALQKRQKKQANETPQVLTYHQIPLLTLDWNNDKAHQWGSADADHIWTQNAKMTLSKASQENTEETDMCESLLNGTDDTDPETSVCDVWQAFLNGPSCTNHSAVRESEWLQTAASVSPSNDKEPGVQYQGFQVGTDTAATLQPHTSAFCQLLSGSCQISSANVALNSEDQPAEACVSSPADDNTAQDASQRSQTNSVTDTRQECCPEGATPVSEGDVDSSTECHRHTIRQPEREEIIGRGEPFTPHAADSVTSSGESETTDMTATPASPNATAGDSIALGAGWDEGLSSSREDEVTGIAHNVMDDMMAFRGTIGEGTKDGERFVFPRHGEEEGIADNCVGNKAATDEEIFRPRKTDECEISQRYADETQREEFRLNQNSENPLRENERNEKRLAQTNADESNLSPTSEENFKQNQIISSESEASEHVASNNKDSEVSEKTEVEDSYCTTSEETKGRIGAAVGITQTQEHGDKALPLKSSSITDEEDECLQRDSIPKENLFVSNQTEEGKSISWEINSAGVKSRQDICDPFPKDKGIQNLVDTSDTRWTHLQDDTKGEEEDGECRITPGEVQVKTSITKKDTSTELQRQHGTLERTEEVMSQRDTDERVSIGKLEIDVGEWRGNVEKPRGEKKYAAAEEKEQELSADVKSSPRVERKSFSEGTKYPITAENTLDVIESGVEETFIERFGEDLVRGIWEEVFGGASSRDIVDEMGAAMADITPDCRLFETFSDDAFDSGVFSLTELPTDPNLATKSNDCSPEETSEPEQTHSHSEDLNSSAQIPILAAQTETTQTSPKEYDNQIKDRSVKRQETERQTEVGFYRSDHQISSCDNLNAATGVSWWSVFFVLSQITRLIVCTLLVAGFFVCVFLYDFPAFFALYVFSCCWWFYKWKRHRVMTNKGMVGVAER